DVGAGQAETVFARRGERQPVARIRQRLEADRQVHAIGGPAANLLVELAADETQLERAGRRPVDAVDVVEDDLVGRVFRAERTGAITDHAARLRGAAPGPQRPVGEKRAVEA